MHMGQVVSLDVACEPRHNSRSERVEASLPTEKMVGYSTPGQRPPDRYS
jgi:hypothetical protein